MKINTTTLLLIAAAGIGVYLLTRPRTLPVATTPIYNPYQYGNPVNSSTSSTAQDIAAGGSAFNNIAEGLSNFF